MTTYASKVSTSTNPEAVSTIYLQATDQSTLSAAYQEIDSALLTSHGVTPSTADFTLSSQQSLVNTATNTEHILTVLLGGIAAISLLVGGIGVMNIMLVSVTERTREIGIRRAIGAKKRNIMTQFIVEAVVLCEVGGVIGVVLGILGGNAVAIFFKAPPVVPFDWIALGLALTFGIYGLIRKLAPLGALEGMSLETMLLAPLAAVALLWGHQSGGMPAHDAHTWLLFVLCGPVTAIPLLLFSAGARRVPLSTMGILQYLTPTILLFLGTLLYDEPFAGPRLAGFALIWTALLLYSVDGWRHRTRPAVA